MDLVVVLVVVSVVILVVGLGRGRSRGVGLGFFVDGRQPVSQCRGTKTGREGSLLVGVLKWQRWQRTIATARFEGKKKE